MKKLSTTLLALLVVLSAGCSVISRSTNTASTQAPTVQASDIILHTLTSSPQPPPPPTLAPPSLRRPEMPSTLQDMPIVYYYFVALASKSAPAGSVVILKDELVLGPTVSDIDRSPDPVTNISSALKAMIADARNVWTSDNLGITSITLKDGAATVALEGDIFGAGDIVLIAAREQIVLTVFAEQAVQSAVITLNGKNIINLGVSHSRNAKPEDFSYTRADVEAFLSENAYSNPQ